MEILNKIEEKEKLKRLKSEHKHSLLKVGLNPKKIINIPVPQKLK